MGVIREIDKGELEKIHRLENDWVGHDHSFEDLQKRFENYPETFLVYQKNGEIIGFVTGRIEGEKMGLESIGVKENFRNQGIGSKLLDVFEQKARKYSEAVTIASADNTEQFYKSNGYNPVQIMLQINKEDLPENYKERETIVDEKQVGKETIFLYAEFSEYSKKLRDQLKEEFNAFEVNTIYEKEIN